MAGGQPPSSTLSVTIGLIQAVQRRDREKEAYIGAGIKERGGLAEVEVGWNYLAARKSGFILVQAYLLFRRLGDVYVHSRI